MFDIEKTVWSAGISNNLVLDICRRECMIKSRQVAGRNAMIGASKNAKDWSSKFRGALDGAGSAVGIKTDGAVETDHAGEAEMRRGSEERLASAKTETQGDGSVTVASFSGLKEGCRSDDVRVDGFAFHSDSMLHESKVLITRPGSRRPAEIIDRDRSVALLAKPQSELLIKRRQAAER